MMNEEKCIRSVLKGNTQAYRELVERYQTGLIIHCENILKHRQDAEDITQEAFIKAFNKLGEFSHEKARFSTWLYRIATNLCIDTLRKQKRKVDIENIEERLESAQPDHIHDDEIRHLREAVENLEPPKYAEIIKAYFWEGKSYQEIATKFDTSTNTIGTWISRAKLQLKESLS